MGKYVGLAHANYQLSLRRVGVQITGELHGFHQF